MNTPVKLALTAAALTATAALAQAAPKVDGVIGAGEYSSTFREPEKGMSVSWRVVGDTIYFGVSARTDGWIGIGLDPSGEKKTGADMYMFVMEDGKLNAMDMVQVKKTGAPKLDTEEGGKDNIAAKAGKITGDTFTVEFSRKLNTGDKQDAVLTAGKGAKLLMAVGPGEKTNKAHAKSMRWEKEIVIK
ncbi:DOMON domain-containing protein [Deinococcus ficus]|uniref:DOMON domain-containing protein n=1 Tax=Deinococcus ficus TaxID=317577 RepID=UPI00174C834C|nr:DOMON domain-containing protein [Deinococcus ficus]GHF89330.1 hypothetical protein GCM10017782_28030 [Deinococcus ficus]